MPIVWYAASLLGLSSEADRVSEIPEFEKWKQEDWEFKASLGYEGALLKKEKVEEKQVPSMHLV